MQTQAAEFSSYAGKFRCFSERSVSKQFVSIRLGLIGQEQDGSFSPMGKPVSLMDPFGLCAQGSLGDYAFGLLDGAVKQIQW
jgi:hypothetical protein